MADLSGGERRRLQLLRLLLAQPNVLLLDEPTNDLDTDTLAALEDLLDSWAGTLVVVSHDRYLLERVCDSTVALLGDGRWPRCPAASTSTSRAARSAVGAGRGDGRRRRKAPTRRRCPGRPQGADPAGAADRDAGQAGGGAARRAGRARHRLRRVAALDAELRDVVAEREAAEKAWLELSD